MDSRLRGNDGDLFMQLNTSHNSVAINPAGPALGQLALTPPIAVAFSGGADSTALLAAAVQRWPGQVTAIHVHHGLQAAADDFVRHCQTVCASWSVPLHVQHVNARHASGQSPEDAARQARYAALVACAHEHGINSVLLGQHADDQLETVLLALSRGAGLPGLSAMAAQFEREGIQFSRPLLHLPSADLRQAVQDLKLPFLDDPSNSDERFTRNRIRARLLPVLDEVFPQCRTTFARSAQHAAQAHSLLCEIAQDDLKTVGVPPNIRSLQSLSMARQANVLRYWLNQHHGAAPSAAQLDQLLLQITACTTRGHQIELKVATGCVKRAGVVLNYLG